jgi:hypothetical protein
VDNSLDQYRLKEWPFREVPDPARCTFIAGRADLKEKLDRIIAGGSNTVSSIYLFWASLGAGKTHAFYYLINNMGDSQRFLPIYTEYPEGSSSFAELYQKLAQNVQWENVAELCFQLFADPSPLANRELSQIRLVQPDVYRGFFLLAEGEDRSTSRLARRWFRGESLSRSELRAATLAKNLSSTGDCAAVMSVLAKLLGLRRRIVDAQSTPFRLIWIIDECQRMQAASPRLNQEINAGLQSTFNSTPDYLTLIISFTGKPEANFPKWLRPELADRIGARNVMLLPPLTKDQGNRFIAELLEAYRTPGTPVPRVFPFTEKSIEYILARLINPTTGRMGLGELVEKNGIRPRAIIKLCHSVLEEHLAKSAALPVDEKFTAMILPK